MSFSASTRHVDQNMTILLSGRMGGLDSLDLGRTIAPGFEATASKVLCVDMSDVTFIDAAGITALLQLHRVVAATGGKVKLTGLYGIVKEVCLLCRLDKVMEIEAS
ncbi:MAG: STAS domain-containing protein [Negativicutes bacterium]|nr:STAS domain-containing protein [Negativicutes bacterium]